jgi:hypothetical protein
LSEDGWFKDSLVPQDVRRALKSELRAIDPVKSELLEEQMKVWQIEAENQRKVIGVVTALASGARVLSQLAADQSAFVRTKLDTILASTLEAAKTGMCRAGTLAPGVNDAVDFYEAVFAKDVCTGETLTPWQQALTGIGLIFGQGKFWRSLDNEISGIGKGIAKAEGIAAEFSGLNRKIFVGERQLQKKWKHAEVFGISGSYTKENAVKYERAISEHISSPKTKVISGTYKHSKNVVHYVNPDNGLLVMKDEAGVFISGWKLSEAQLKNVLERGSL